MSWMSVIKIVKPDTVPWLERINSEHVNDYLNFFKSHQVAVSVKFITPNEKIVTFKFPYEHAYNQLQESLKTFDREIERDEYFKANGIVTTKIYLGPEENYIDIYS